MFEYFSDTCDEQGGIIGTSKNLYCISHFFPDHNSSSSSSTYSPNSKHINAQIKIWSNNGICFLGFIHSHIGGCNILSKEDKQYIFRLLVSFPHLQFMWFPIFSKENGIQQLTFYKCYLNKGTLITQKYIRNDTKQIRD